MPKKEVEGFWSNFRRFFARGLVTILPTLLTIVVMVRCFEFVQKHIGTHITEGVIRVVVATTKNYPKISDDEIEAYRQDNRLSEQEVTSGRISRQLRLAKLRETWHRGPRSLVGFLLAVVLIYLLGYLLASYLGHRLWVAFEEVVQRIPGFKQVYAFVKQVTDFLIGESKVQQFNRVVAVPYPSRGIWSIGLVTGSGLRDMQRAMKEDYLCVFIPSSPTPLTGYVITVPSADVVDLPIAIEDALRYVVSGGVIVPPHQVRTTDDSQVTTKPVVISAGPPVVPGQDGPGSASSEAARTDRSGDSAGSTQPKSPDDTA